MRTVPHPCAGAGRAGGRAATAVPAASRAVVPFLLLACITSCGGSRSPAPGATDDAEGDGVAAASAGPTLDALRQAAARFRDVNVALAEGYIEDPTGMCLTAEMMGLPAADGAMGIHYFRPDLLGITGPPNPRVIGTGTHTDFTTPAVLLYEPQADGSLELVGVENLVFEAAWRAAGHRQPPSFEGVPYERMEDDPATPVDEAHGFAPHYDLHAWLYRHNPKGTFAPFNPAVTCRPRRQAP